ncbi:MAG: hypothetical protein MRZ79_00460 [Bacteroidia bacterium]|nr:hypothetical protein [Bacteroidia bacterium]
MYLTWTAYAIYLIFVIGVIMRVGKVIHKIGEVYLKFFFPGEHTVVQINNLLLIGYYLLNIGYSVFVLTLGHEDLTSGVGVFEWVVHKLAFILLVLGVLHVNNMALIYLAHKMKKIRV